MAVALTVRVGHLPTYIPPTPSATLQPGVDYDAGVEPFIAAGLVLTVVTPNMPIPGTSLTSDSQGNIVVNVAGQTLVGLHLPTGYIHVTADSCTVDRCMVEGYLEPTQTATKGLLDGTALAATNMIVKDSTFIAAHPGGVWDGMRAHGGYFLRVKTRYVTDCFGIYNSITGHKTDPIVILAEGCDFDKMTYVSPDLNHPSDSPVSGSHNDCIQIQGAGPGSSIEVRYSTLWGFCDPTRDDSILRDSSTPNVAGGYNAHYGTVPGSPNRQSNSGVQVTQGQSTVSGLNFHDNWGDGGAQWWNTGTAQGVYTNFGTVAANKLGKNRRSDIPLSQTINIPTSATGVTTTPANTWIDDGTNIVVKRF